MEPPAEFTQERQLNHFPQRNICVTASKDTISTAVVVVDEGVPAPHRDEKASGC